MHEYLVGNKVQCSDYYARRREVKNAHTDWEASVRISTGSKGIRQQHSIQPRVNDAIAGTQRYATAIADEIW